jgi:hypothetical protein
MNISRTRLQKIINEEIRNSLNEALLNESLSAIMSLGKFIGKQRSRAIRGQERWDRVRTAESVLTYLRNELGHGAKEAAEEVIESGAIVAGKTLTAAEITGIAFALGIPMLAIWSLGKGLKPEGQLRNLSDMATPRGEDRYQLYFTMEGMPARQRQRFDRGRISDPFGHEYSQTYHASDDHPITAIILDQDLALELFNDGIIGDEIMEWAREWWRKIANAKRIYLREKYLADQEYL